MASQARTNRCPNRGAMLVTPAIAAAPGLLVAFGAAVFDPSASAWSLLRPAALLPAGWIPVRLVREAAAYYSDGAGRTEGRAVRLVHRTGDLPGVPATSTYSFGQAALPGRQALPSGGAHI